MEQREKLIELLDIAFLDSDDNYGIPNREQVADHLLANGVVVLPYKVGDTVYAIYGGKVYECRVSQTRTFQQENGDMTYAGNAIFEVENLFYRDGRKDEVTIAVRFYPKGTYHDCYDTREEAERVLAKQKGGELK